MTGVFESGSAEETEAIAARFAKELSPGDVIRLEGELGAGKTAFVRGLAAGLGVRGRVASPTFCIVREHPGALPLIHLDLYRLHGPEDLDGIGWEEYLASGAVIAVEWPERAGDLIPADACRVVISANGGDDRRTIEISRPRGT